MMTNINVVISMGNGFGSYSSCSNISPATSAVSEVTIAWEPRFFQRDSENCWALDPREKRSP